MQPKYKLLLDVVRVLGAEKAMEMFEKTAQIQEDGGVLTSQGDKKYVMLEACCPRLRQKQSEMI